MPRVSRIQIEGKRLSYFISNLWNTFTLIENREETLLFLKDLLTPTEIRMLAKRIQIAKMLLEGYKYQDIIPFVRVTASTISSVNNQLQFGNGGYIKIIEKLIKMEERKQKEFEKKGSPKVFYPAFGGLADLATLKVAEKILKNSKEKSVEKTLG